jgi:hypothetical protein
VAGTRARLAGRLWLGLLELTTGAEAPRGLIDVWFAIGRDDSQVCALPTAHPGTTSPRRRFTSVPTKRLAARRKIRTDSMALEVPLHVYHPMTTRNLRAHPLLPTLVTELSKQAALPRRRLSSPTRSDQKLLRRSFWADAVLVRISVAIPISLMMPWRTLSTPLLVGPVMMYQSLWPVWIAGPR